MYFIYFIYFSTLRNLPHAVDNLWLLASSPTYVVACPLFMVKQSVCDDVSVLVGFLNIYTNCRRTQSTKCVTIQFTTWWTLWTWSFSTWQTFSTWSTFLKWWTFSTGWTFPSWWTIQLVEYIHLCDCVCRWQHQRLPWSRWWFREWLRRSSTTQYR